MGSGEWGGEWGGAGTGVGRKGRREGGGTCNKQMQSSPSPSRLVIST